MSDRDRTGAVELDDGGLQLERTSLAWQRTSCSLLVAAAVGVRIAAHLGQSWLGVLLVPAAFVAACAAIARVRTSTPGRRELAMDDEGLVILRRPASRPCALLSLAVVATGVAALILVLTVAPDDTPAVHF
ncbi:DUF202 domain-containing protein [Williamsia sp. SKLECPSW1]